MAATGIAPTFAPTASLETQAVSRRLHWLIWGAEGAGAHWPGDDLALPVLVGVLALVSFAFVRLLRRQRAVLRPVEAEA